MIRLAMKAPGTVHRPISVPASASSGVSSVLPPNTAILSKLIATEMAESVANEMRGAASVRI